MARAAKALGRPHAAETICREVVKRSSRVECELETVN
jgi:hypothetical protein